MVVQPPLTILSPQAVHLLAPVEAMVVEPGVLTQFKAPEVLVVTQVTVVTVVVQPLTPVQQALVAVVVVVVQVAMVAIQVVKCRVKVVV
jgi:hypothetical protein